MALFTNKNDTDLPYLTTFYQVDAVSGYEEGGRGLCATEMHEYLRRDWEKHELQRNTGKVFEADAEVIAGYVYLHMAVSAIMDAMADRTEENTELGQVDTDYLTYIQDRLRHLAENEVLMTPVLHYRTKKGGLIWEPVEQHEERTLDIALVTFEIPYDYHLYTERFILDELRQLLFLHLPVRRCHECSNPYVPYRNSRIFCSYRCAARNGQRKRRAFDSGTL